MGLIIVSLIVFFALKLLRTKYEWVDTVLGLLVIVTSVIAWISEGFWVALVVFLVLCMIYGFMIKDKTKVIINGRKAVIECHKCQYEDMQIIRHVENGVIARCKRCGDERLYMWKS
ncbi:MAG: hypothetical protein J6Q34_04725 [Bacteroidales bacterium]|nr:hypothetical protein [Bacteroidales bacterium]